ncbi:VOC family protein [Parvularcula dongshanensis]|uniref:PhnB protein n=1 Tax=Parvularcula dongshanensis TaxID=1173995 RepID=A0A840I4T5_9PROT|nr:VOC family protein [Parvularcula dongshanensis]MBB4659372.1 PhnB protein [Parvularcula dongshanensis]
MTEMTQRVYAGMVVKDTKTALALYEKAFGARLGDVMEHDGAVLHASFELQGNTVFINDDLEMMPRRMHDGVQSVGFYVYFDDVDAAHKQAVDAGCEGLNEPSDMFWGDRTSVVKDPFGYVWTLAQQVRQMTPEEMEEARKAEGW